MNNRYPIFVPTKGRYARPMTIRLFQELNIDFKIVVENQDYEEYSKLVEPNNILVLPFENEGLTKTRNWIWDYAEKMGVNRFWTFDDNIVGLYRANNNKQVKVADDTILCVIEDFADRYDNLPIVGMNYHGFCKAKQKLPPFYKNTRVYSNMLIQTNTTLSDGNKLRNRIFFNDDTDLCLQVLSDGKCTVLFNAFLIDKQQTMTVKGGMTEYYENTNNRLEFAQELKDKFPHLVDIKYKFGRWHHYVNYNAFKNNNLKFNPNIDIPSGINNYGMELIKI